MITMRGRHNEDQGDGAGFKEENVRKEEMIKNV